MGGGYSHGFSYDAFNRLAGATGSWLNAADNNYQLTMGYEGMHRIQSKHQQHNLNANPVADNDYQHTYLYEHPTKPNALTSIVANGQETETFTYDLNGNVLHHNRVGGESRKMAWDELTYQKGRMSGGHSVSEPSAPARGLHKAINIADAAVQHHLYDAQGERGLKGLGTITEFYVNGETKGYGASLGNYVRYVSGYFVVDGHGRVSKHYYAGAERVLSRLAGDVAGYLEAEDLDGEQLSTLRSRQQRDVQAAIKTWDLQIFPFLNYPKPTDNCSLYPSGSEEHKQPAQTSGHHWIKEYESGSSGCLCDQQNTCTEVLYWYHPDHLGSSTFLSDAAGEPYQFVLYLPFGELFTEQRAAEWSTPYLFNAKELDSETGLYYYGARYYDPRVSTWWGVDPLANKYPTYSPYTYTLNNPIRFIDPDGRSPETVKPSGENEEQRLSVLEVIKNTLTRHDAAFVQLDAEGNVDKRLINTRESSSDNFNYLKDMVNSDMVLEIYLADNYDYVDGRGHFGNAAMPYFPADKYSDFDIEGSSMGGLSTGESGFLGKTLFPDMSGLENSPTTSVRVIINKKLSPAGKAEMYSHEANGQAHIYMMNGGASARERASHQPNNFKETNIELRDQIIGSKRETIQNMKGK